jgi:Regulator of ribonuclease activity B
VIRFDAKILMFFGCALASCGQQVETKEKAVSGQPYEQCIGKLLNPSFALMERMASQGVDLNKQRLISHLLVGPDANIAKAAAFATSKGFTVVEKGEGRLLITEEAPVIEDWIKHTIPTFCSFAAEYGLTYDGWDVDMSKDNLKQN